MCMIRDGSQLQATHIMSGNNAYSTHCVEFPPDICSADTALLQQLPAGGGLCHTRCCRRLLAPRQSELQAPWAKLARHQGARKRYSAWVCCWDGRCMCAHQRARGSFIVARGTSLHVSCWPCIDCVWLPHLAFCHGSHASHGPPIFLRQRSG